MPFFTRQQLKIIIVIIVVCARDSLLPVYSKCHRTMHITLKKKISFPSLTRKASSGRPSDSRRPRGIPEYSIPIRKDYKVSVTPRYITFVNMRAWEHTEVTVARASIISLLPFFFCSFFFHPFVIHLFRYVMSRESLYSFFNLYFLMHTYSRY